MVVVGLRTVGRGLDADDDGVVVRNTLRAGRFPDAILPPSSSKKNRRSR
jgi:hypothetical protein